MLQALVLLMFTHVTVNKREKLFGKDHFAHDGRTQVAKLVTFATSLVPKLLFLSPWPPKQMHLRALHRSKWKRNQILTLHVLQGAF